MPTPRIVCFSRENEQNLSVTLWPSTGVAWLVSRSPWPPMPIPATLGDKNWRVA